MSGLQCWDASGRLITDIGDYNMRYMGSRTLSVGPGANSWNVSFPGMSQSGWIVTLSNTLFWTDYYCIPYNGQFNVQYLPVSAPYAETLTFEIYKFV